MKKIILVVLVFTTCTFFASAQSVVLVERFTETGCGACGQNDSAFNAVMKASGDKVAIISYHCFYSLDTFYQYNKDGYQRYFFYKMNQGFPSGLLNGKKPIPSSSHLSYINTSRVDAEYNKAPQFKIEIACKPSGKVKTHTTDITVKATALKDNPAKDLRLFVVLTENNINHEQRYHSKTVNGLNEFNHVFRAMLPDTNGTVIGSQMKGQENKLKLSVTNDDKEINYKEVQLVVFIQDAETLEILGTATTKESPYIRKEGK